MDEKMKFDYEEVKTIQNFFKWINEILNDEKRYKTGDSYIEDLETGIITKLDIGYGIELLEFLEVQYYREYYKKNLESKKGEKPTNENISSMRRKR